MESQDKFAASFKPKFNSFDLKFCGNDFTEKDELEFVVGFWPFSKYSGKIFRNFDVKPTHREMIKIEWTNQLPKGIFTFDDDLVFNKVWPTIEQELESFIFQNENIDPIKKTMLDNSKNKELDELKDWYKPLIKKAVRCERGLRLEKRLIQSINQNQNCEFRKTYKREIDFGSYKLLGIPDGIDNKKKMIIEIKTKNSIQPVSNNERLQCLSYLKIMEYHKCLLVQSDQNGEQDITEILNDHQQFTDEIFIKLKNFVDKYRNMTEEEFLEKLYFYCEASCTPVSLIMYLQNA